MRNEFCEDNNPVGYGLAHTVENVKSEELVLIYKSHGTGKPVPYEKNGDWRLFWHLTIERKNYYGKI